MGRPKKEKPNRADGLYEVKITVGKKMDGSLIRKSFYSSVSKEDAKKQAEKYKIEKEVANATGQNLVKKAMDFTTWANRWLEVYKKDTVRDFTYVNTYQRIVQRHLCPYFKDALLTSIYPIDIQSFYNMFSQKYSQSQVKKAQLCLNAIFEAAIDNDLCYKNPAKGMKAISAFKPTEKRTYNQNEVELILNFAKTHKCGPSIFLLLKMGLRRGEMLALTWQDIDFDKQTISISKSVALVNNKVTVGIPKTETSIRILPMDEELSEYLYHLPAEKTGYLISVQGHVMSPNNWTLRWYNRFMDDLCKEYPGLERLTPHELRHTCGTLLYKKTGNIYAVSKFLGHADIMITTKTYVHEDVEGLRDSLGF